MNQAEQNKEDEKIVPELRNVRNFLTKKAIALLGPVEEGLIFHPFRPESDIFPPADYARYGFVHLGGFKEDNVKVMARNGSFTNLGLWVREPDDASKPTYVVFHGRHGHWALTGQKGEKSHDYDRAFRLHWLDELAKSGAGVIAVHTRWQGISRERDIRERKIDTRIGEKAYQQDIDALSDYVLKKKKCNSDETLAGSDLIVAGESNGGALATMMAEKLTELHQPPAVLALINSYACMADAAALVFRGKKLLTPQLPKLPPEELLQDPKAAAICRYHRGIMREYAKNKFDTEKRIGALDATRTGLYVANNLDDPTIPVDQHGKVCGAGDAHGMEVKPRLIKGDFVDSRYSDAHTNWRADMMVRDIEDFHKKRRDMPIAEEAHQRNGYAKYVPGRNGHTNGYTNGYAEERHVAANKRLR